MAVTTKVCKRCNKRKPLKSFYKSTGKRQGVQTYCKVCSDATYRSYKAQNPERDRQVRQERIQRNGEWLMAYLLEHPCVDCGEADPIVLEFDHVRGIKCYSVTQMVPRASLQALQDEVAKCEVRCANCHRRKTYTEHEGWKFTLLASAR